MDADGILTIFGEFDERRAERLGRAQEFLAGAHNLEEITIDIANLMMLTYTALQVTETPQGFRSGSG
jgi:hypothetical protein